MKENMFFEADSLDEAFEHWYDELTNMNDEKESRDGAVCGEIINAITVLKNPTNNVMKSEIRNLSMKYAVGELLWYMSGNNELTAIQLYTHNWDRMSDDGKTVNSNYGYCIKSKYGFDQWRKVKSELLQDPNSRRAVIHIKSPNDDMNSKDVNCTICLQFFIRDGKLYMTTYMRSNDIWLGFPYDVFQFTCMQILMAMELGLKLGTYTHVVGSLHLYSRNKV